MSLNRYEQAIFDYWERQPDEKRHWQGKVVEMTRRPGWSPVAVRGLERELWAYAREREAHVPALREFGGGDGRTSLLNLAEHLVRLWGPAAKPKRPSAGTAG